MYQREDKRFGAAAFQCPYMKEINEKCHSTKSSKVDFLLPIHTKKMDLPLIYVLALTLQFSPVSRKFTEIQISEKYALRDKSLILTLLKYGVYVLTFST